MNGRTIIKSLQTTVASEAYISVKSHAAVAFYSRKGREDRKRCIDEIVSEMCRLSNREEPKTIGDMIGAYLYDMSNTSYVAMRNRILREESPSYRPSERKTT